MGTFGLGGLHRKSTWLYPVATAGALPPTAVDGSVAVTLDTNDLYEYDASLPGWIPVTSGGGGGTTNVFHWTAGMAWSTVYSALVANGTYGIVMVDPDVGPRVITPVGGGAETNLSHVLFIGDTVDSAAVSVDLAEGVRLTSGVLRSRDIAWRSLATATPIVSAATANLNFQFNGGGFTAYSGVGGISPINLTGGFNRIILENEAVFDGSGFSTPGTTLVTMTAGTTLDAVVLTGSTLGGFSFSSGGAATVNADQDAESDIITGAAQALVTLNVNLLDEAALVYYDDSLTTPALGVDTVQEAIDALKFPRLREVLLTINAVVLVGTALNIQTGAGGGPATVTGDATTELPTTGAAFAAAGVVVVLRNGQSLSRGTGLGVEEAQWLSTTQLAFDRVLRPGDVIRVISPLP